MGLDCRSELHVFEVKKRFRADVQLNIYLRRYDRTVSSSKTRNQTGRIAYSLLAIECKQPEFVGFILNSEIVHYSETQSLNNNFIILGRRGL